MEREIFLWLGLMVVFLIIELATVGLTSIWFSGGALAALLVSLVGAGMVIQIAVFVVVSAVLVIFTRPFAAKYVNVHHVKTNCDELIGSVVKVTETVDNFAQTGTAIAQGKEWTARCKSDKDRIEKDSLAKVTAISGVKLILEKCNIWTYYLDDHYYDRGVASCVEYPYCSAGACVCCRATWRIQGDMGRWITF